MVSTLLKGALASFLLLEVSRSLEIAFSIWQGDLGSSVFFTIHIQPFLVALGTASRVLSMTGLQKVTDGHMDKFNSWARIRWILSQQMIFVKLLRLTAE
jgi:hypothetical protein